MCYAKVNATQHPYKGLPLKKTPQAKTKLSHNAIPNKIRCFYKSFYQQLSLRMQQDAARSR
jgi:hypothetical protein